MIRGVYRAAAAMLTEMLRQDAHAHNLANADTTGFKRLVPRTGGVVTDMAPGDLRMTQAPLDVALRSGGYFVVDTGAGRVYTRNGHFTLGPEGLLVNGQGFRVLGLRGPIRLRGARIEITDDGSLYADGRFVDKLLVVDFPAGAVLERGQDARVAADRAPAQVARYAVVQGALEASNVNPILEVSAMQSGLRIYEANARAISQHDRALGKLIEVTTG